MSSKIGPGGSTAENQPRRALGATGECARATVTDFKMLPLPLPLPPLLSATNTPPTRSRVGGAGGLPVRKRKTECDPPRITHPCLPPRVQLQPPAPTAPAPAANLPPTSRSPPWSSMIFGGSWSFIRMHTHSHHPHSPQAPHAPCSRETSVRDFSSQTSLTVSAFLHDQSPRAHIIEQQPGQLVTVHLPWAVRP